MTDALRYRLDDLRRFATALGVGAGLTASRAAAFAAHLAWYDESGLAPFGLETLPAWLDRMSGGDVDPAAEGTVATETLGTAVFDGKGGIPALILARAAEMAVEKSRDAGVGLVRVTGVRGAGPLAAVVAAIATGPNLGAVLGPGGSLALALPNEQGPAVFDSALAGPADLDRPALAAACAPWLAAMVHDGDYLVGAVAVKAVERLTTVHERVAAMLGPHDDAPGRLGPGRREVRCREVREHGVAVTPEAWTRFRQWAERLGLALPPPASSARAIAHAPGDAG